MTRVELPGSLYDPATGAELADATAAGGLRLPEKVELRGGWLEFRYAHWPHPNLRWLVGWPGRSLLPDLASADTPAKLERRATAWGRLGTCQHGRAEPLEGTSGQGYRVFTECVRCWEREAAWARGLLDGLSRAVGQGDNYALRDVQRRLNDASASTMIAPVALSDGYKGGQLQTRVALSTVPGLHGYVVLSALSLFAQAGASALPNFCSGCGTLYAPRYRVRRDRAGYCPDCATRARQRRAARAYRARQKASRDTERLYAVVSDLEAAAAGAQAPSEGGGDCD